MLDTRIFCITILVIALSLVRSHATVTGYFDSVDKKRFLEVLVKSLKVQPDDITSAYYGATGFKLLDEPIVAVLLKENCEHLKANFKDGIPPENVYYALNAYSLLSCSGKLHTDKTIQALRAVLDNEKSSIPELRYALESLQIISQSAPSPAKVAQTIQTRLKEDDSLVNLGNALHASALLGNSGKFILNRIEDITAQADEIDGRLLQWEGGLSITSLLLTGLYRLPNAKPLTQEQSDKFAAYLLSRKTVQTPKGVAALLQAAVALSGSNVSPVSVTVVGNTQVTVEKPEVRVRVSDLFGKVLKSAPSSVVAQSATRVPDDVVVLSKQPLTKGSDATEFVLPLRVDPSQYKLALTIGSQSAALTVRVLGPVTLNWLEIGVSDVDGTTAPRLTRLQPSSKLPAPLQADSSQHLIAKISLSRRVHQVFLQLSSGKKEIIFVAEPDSSNQVYKIEVNLASELQYSGTFDLVLIVGDAVITNPIRWNLGTLEAKLGASEAPSKPQVRAAKPEIQHVFRPAEKRPPQAVSMFFTALALAPLLLLLILWLKIGINLGNFTFSAVPFHLGLAAILGLFTLFWLRLDMFTTCGWLIPIGGFTFLSGHRLLSRIARQKKTEK